MQGVKLFRIDLTQISGKGDVACPKCGVKISPNDKTEKAYSILEPVMKGDSLEEILLQCNKYRSQIHLTGFHVLNK